MAKRYVCDHAGKCPIKEKGCVHKTAHRMRTWHYQECTSTVECTRLKGLMNRSVQVRCVEVSDA